MKNDVHQEAAEKTLPPRTASAGRPKTIPGLVRDLSKMVFTSARDWHRSVRINRQERDYIVRVLRAHDALFSMAKLLEQTIVYEMKKCERAGDDEGVRVKIFALLEARAAISAAVGDRSDNPTGTV